MVALVLAAGCWVQTSIPVQQRLIQIAKHAVECAVRGVPNEHRPDMAIPAKPVFVTIECKGKVVGCRGELAAKGKSLEEEISMEAESAAAHDPHYKPLRAEQLKDFQVTVTIVDHIEPIESVDGLQPSDGLVLEAGDRKGIVLPWEGRDPKVRLEWAYRKAGVARGSSAKLFQLIAERFRG